MLNNTKKHILTVQLVSCIIINVLKLRELHIKIMSSELINKLSLLKDLSMFSYDIITLNLFSMVCNSIPLYLKLKKYMGRILKKIKKE